MALPENYQHALHAFISDVRDGSSGRDKERRAPREFVDRLRELRLGAIRLSKEEGGQGISLRELLLLVIDIAAADPNVAHILRNHFSFVELVKRATNPAIRQKWLAEIQSGKIFGLATAELGTKRAENSGLSTRISRANGRYRVNGRKFYSTGALYSDFLRISGVLDDGSQITVVVPSRREGVTLVDDWDGIGQRLSGSGSTLFENVEVDETDFLTRQPQDGNSSKYRGALPQLTLNAVVAGIIQEVEREGIGLVQRRHRTWAQAAAETPAKDSQVLAALGEISSYAFAARAVISEAATALDEVYDSVVDGVPDFETDLRGGLAVSRSKVVIDEWGPRVANALFDLAGASAVTRSANLDRHWRNIRTIISHNPAMYRTRIIGDYIVNGVHPEV
jgi:alkylation response protein AidB-like acyl-CoA dehydrogenase